MGLGSDDDGEQSPEIEMDVGLSGSDGTESFFERTDIAAVDELDEVAGGNEYAVPIQLADAARDEAIDTFQAVGADESPEDASVTVTIEGDVTVENTFGISDELADAIVTDKWDGEFLLILGEREQAETVREALLGG